MRIKWVLDNVVMVVLSDKGYICSSKNVSIPTNQSYIAEGEDHVTKTPSNFSESKPIYLLGFVTADCKQVICFSALALKGMSVANGLGNYELCYPQRSD